MKRNLHELFSLVKNLFFEFVCFPEFENPKNGSRKTKIWKKITNFAKIMKNQQMKLVISIMIKMSIFDVFLSPQKFE